MALHIAAPSRFLGVGLGYSAKAVQLHGARLIERLPREICSLRRSTRQTRANPTSCRTWRETLNPTEETVGAKNDRIQMEAVSLLFYHLITIPV
jgi:hypothetical protein